MYQYMHRGKKTLAQKLCGGAEDAKVKTSKLKGFFFGKKKNFHVKAESTKIIVAKIPTYTA